MAVTRINVERFVSLANHCPVIDVRSPEEFAHAHIPGACNLALFDNEERRVVGTAYKQESRQAAIKKGLMFFGPKMVRMIEEAEQLTGNHKATRELENDNLVENRNSKTIVVHCWRGGMRSAGVAWLLDLYGFKVYTLDGGYKSFRNWVLSQFEKAYAINLVGGYTGSGKTHILDEFRKRGCSVVDLEGIASHKGSAFGNIDMPPQPSQEMFENLLAGELWRADTPRRDPEHHRPGVIWLEDESQRIGNLNIPPAIWKQMRERPLYFLDVPFEKRLEHIIEEYGKAGKEKIELAILRIKKRLGGLETKNAVKYLHGDNIKDCFSILLAYYDKWYKNGLIKRKSINAPVVEITAESLSAQHNASIILTHFETLQNE